KARTGLCGSRASGVSPAKSFRETRIAYFTMYCLRLFDFPGNGEDDIGRAKALPLSALKPLNSRPPFFLSMASRRRRMLYVVIAVVIVAVLIVGAFLGGLFAVIGVANTKAQFYNQPDRGISWRGHFQDFSEMLDSAQYVTSWKSTEDWSEKI